MASRYFRPSYSQQVVPSYAPLPLDALRYGAEQAMAIGNQADADLDTLSATHQDLLGQLSGPNREKAATILQENKDFIDRLISPESNVRYQDMPSLIRRQARKTQSRLSPYIEDSSRMGQELAQARELFNKGDISQTYYNYIQRRAGDYKGLDFDENGNPIGFTPTPIVRKIDINSEIDKFMKHLQEGNEEVILRDFVNDPRFVSELKVMQRSEEGREAIRSLIASRLLSNPETSQYMQAEWIAENDLRERTGNEPIEFKDFVNNWVNPYSEASGMTRVTERLINNPGYSREGTYPPPLPGMLTVGMKSSDINSPAKMNIALDEGREALNEITEIVSNRLNSLAGLGVSARIDPETGMIQADNMVGSDNIDYSAEINKYNRQLKTAIDNIKALQNEDKRLREKANISEADAQAIREIFQAPDAPSVSDMHLTIPHSFSGLAENLRKIFESVDYETLEKSREKVHPLKQAWQRLNITGGSTGITKADRLIQQGKNPLDEFMKSPAFTKALEQLSPEHKAYIQLYKDNAAFASQDVQVNSLGPSGDKYMKEWITKFDPVLEYGKTREPLTDEDREKLDLRNAVFSGVFTDDGGQLMAAYMAYPPSSSDKTAPELVVTPAPPQARYHLLAAGNVPEFDAMVLNQLSPLSTLPGGQKSVALPVTDKEGNAIPGADIKVELADRSDQATGIQYTVYLPYRGGIIRPVPVSSAQEVADEYRRYVKQINKIE